ncbi:MAG: hypothetical protein F6K18_27320 [Okeania sp. SIO2C2]|nr:hypothetical protein [Okeania sp. SIO2C2]
MGSRDIMQLEDDIEITSKMRDDRFMFTAAGVWNFYLMAA